MRIPDAAIADAILFFGFFGGCFVGAAIVLGVWTALARLWGRRASDRHARRMRRLREAQEYARARSIADYRYIGLR